MGNYYYGAMSSRASNELRHWRTKGSRNGYSKYSWYTPIGEKAQGPQLPGSYVNRSRYGYSTQSQVVRPQTQAQSQVQQPVQQRQQTYTQNPMREQRDIRENAATNQQPKIAARMDERTNAYSGQEQAKEERKKNSAMEGLVTATTFLVGLLEGNTKYVKAAVDRFGMAAKSFIDSLGFKVEKALNKNVDEETGLKLKQREMTPEEDLARVNPEVYDFNTNTKSNCMLCTSTYILRRKGYDVTANKASVGYEPNDLVDWFPDAEIMRFSSQYRNTKDQQKNYDSYVKAAHGDNMDYAKDIVSQMEKKYPPGSYGNIMVYWPNGGGHSMIFEINDKGKMIIRDAQVNKTYEDPTEILRSTVNIFSARLDNVDVDPNYLKEICN